MLPDTEQRCAIRGWALSAGWLVLASNSVMAIDVESHAKLRDLRNELVSQHGFDRGEFDRLLNGAKVNEKVIKLINRQAEALPWYKYRKLFITDTAAASGTRFWRDNKESLGRAEAEYGVPAPVIVAIIGVETRYGAVTGNFDVLDSLVTLTLEYPRRSDFFLSELREFLLLARDERMDASQIKGSYAGALGIPQFIPSSYRAYAVDFDGDGRRDLLTRPADAIGSVANYLSRHNWRRGEPVAATIREGALADSFVVKGLKPTTTVGRLRDAGINIADDISASADVGVVRLEEEGGWRYDAAFHNFYVITKYNRSTLYAMAVHDLSEYIANAY